jgi:uncharacterized damage-inducible protein DinB
MATSPDVQDMLALTQRYYARLRELLNQIPEARLDARVAPGGLGAVETVRHVCDAERRYMNMIDGGSRVVGEAAEDKPQLLAALQRSELEMVRFLQSLTEEMLAATRDVAAWWGEGEPRSARLILMHSLAHKYYHCGQLQSILHALASEA